MKLFRGTVFWSHIAILFLSVVLLYLPTLNHGFILDDHIGVEQNKTFQDTTHFFTDRYTFFQRILYHTGYLLGGMEPWGFRLVNLVMHSASVLSAYLLISLLATPAVAFFAAVLFAVHPILTESVVWISSYSYPLYSVFILLTLSAYILFVKTRNKAWLAASVGLSIFGILASEKAVVLPLIIVAYHLSTGTVKKAWKTASLFFVATALMSIQFFNSLGSRVTTFSASDVSGSVEYLNPLKQVPIVLGTYINLIFWPNIQTIYHLNELGYPLPIFVIYAVLTSFYMAALVYAFIKNKLVFFMLSLFFIASLPALVPIHIIQIAAERYAYLGTLGLVAAVVMTLFNLVKKYKVNVIWLYVILSICVAALAWRSTVRLQDWESEMSLRQATLRDAPYSARAHNNVGIQLMNEGNDEEALVEYKKSIALMPEYSHPYHNIGHMLALRGRFAEALPFYLKAVSLNQYEWKTRQDLGQVYFMLKKYPDSKEQLQLAITQGSPEVQRLQTILDRIKELGY